MPGTSRRRTSAIVPATTPPTRRTAASSSGLRINIRRWPRRHAASIATAYRATVLAYVFWHVPAAGPAAGAYEDRLAAFHAALRAAPSRGLGPTATFGLDGIPWLGGAPG